MNTLKEQIEAASANNIPPNIFCTNVAAVKYDARPTSSSFSNEMGLRYKPLPSFDEALRNFKMLERLGTIKDYASTIGVDIGIVQFTYPFIPGLPYHYRIFFGKDTEFSEHIDLINGLYRASESPLILTSPKDEYFKALEEEAKLLDYPECCTQRFVDDRRRGISAEQRVHEQLKKYVIAQNTQPIHINPDVLSAFFSLEFFPCSPLCSEAKNRGEKMKMTYNENDKDLANVLQHVILPYHVFRAALPIFMSFNPTEFSEIIDCDITSYLEGQESVIQRRVKIE